MKKLVLLAILFLSPLALRAQTALQPIPDGRIDFLGDSITYRGDFIIDFETALISRGKDPETLNLGLPSESATVLTPQEQAGHLKAHGFGHPIASDRFARAIEQTQPTVVFIAYGMNDAMAMAESKVPLETATQRYVEAITDLRNVALSGGAKRVIVLAPTIYDAGPGKSGGLTEAMLAAFSKALMAKSASAGWEVIDLHTPMLAAFETARKTNPNFRFAGDGVHPAAAGMELMADTILHHLFPNEQPPAKPLTAKVHGLLTQRMGILRDAWMTKIGYKRPGLPKGLPLEEAQAKAKVLTQQIDSATGAKFIP